MSSEKESESRKLGSEEISREFKTLVSSHDLHSLNHMQHTILGRLQDSNAVLSHFNDFSQHCFAEISGDIARNTRVLKSVKSDLDYIFQKLSNSAIELSKNPVFHGHSYHIDVRFHFLPDLTVDRVAKSMKSKIMATYPDAFPEDSTSEVIDRRPDLEMPK